MSTRQGKASRFYDIGPIMPPPYPVQRSPRKMGGVIALEKRTSVLKNSELTVALLKHHGEGNLFEHTELGIVPYA